MSASASQFDVFTFQGAAPLNHTSNNNNTGNNNNYARRAPRGAMASMVLDHYHPCDNDYDYDNRQQQHYHFQHANSGAARAAAAAAAASHHPSTSRRENDVPMAGAATNDSIRTDDDLSNENSGTLNALVADPYSFHALLMAIRAPQGGHADRNAPPERVQIHATNAGVRFTVVDASKCLQAVVFVKAASFAEYHVDSGAAAAAAGAGFSHHQRECRFDVDHGELCDAVAIVAAAVSERHNDGAGGSALRLHYPADDGAVSLVTETASHDGAVVGTCCAYASLRTLDAAPTTMLEGEGALGAHFETNGAANFIAETSLLKEAMDDMDMMADTHVRIMVGGESSSHTAAAAAAPPNPYQQHVSFSGAGPQGHVAVEIRAGPQCTLTLPDAQHQADVHRRGHKYQIKHLRRAFARAGQVSAASSGEASHGFGSAFAGGGMGGAMGGMQGATSPFETRAKVHIDLHGRLKVMHMLTWQDTKKLDAFRGMGAASMPPSSSGVADGEENYERALVATVQFEVFPANDVDDNNMDDGEMTTQTL